MKNSKQGACGRCGQGRLEGLQLIDEGAVGASDLACLSDGAGGRMLTCLSKDEGAGARDASPLKQELQALDFADVRDGVKRHARLAASLAAAGFDLHHTSWGIHIVASAVQSRSMATICSIASFVQEVAR